jgi:hypothetical protein
VVRNLVRKERKYIPYFTQKNEPQSSSIGDLYYNMTTKKVRYYSGSGWISLNYGNPTVLYYYCRVCNHTLKKIQTDEHKAYCCARCKVAGEL